MAKIGLQQLGSSLGTAIQNFGQHTAKAAAAANGVSAQAQAAQGAFNQASANQANMINDQSMANQYAFNSAQMQAANEYNTQAWNTAAAWNEAMWQKQADFNAEQAEINRQFTATEAQKNRDWQTQMSNTAYQRAMKDMAAAGLNPILAYSQGGAQVPSGAVAQGSTASVGGAQMSSATAQMASGGLLGANAASEGNYTGQMEYMSGMLGLLSAAISGISSAVGAMGQLGDFGEGLGQGLASILNMSGDNYKYGHTKENGKEKNYLDYVDDFEKEYYYNGLGSAVKNVGDPWQNYWYRQGQNLRQKIFK